MAERNLRNKSQKISWIKITLILIALVLIVGIPTVGVIWGYRTLFTENQRFILRKVEVVGGGYWQEHVVELEKLLDLNVGSDNLFVLSTGELREKMARVPNVDFCTVVRVLPDTLRLRITERIPRASVTSPRSRWVVDEKGVVMERRQAMNVSASLPVLTGRFGAPTPGKVLADSENALEIVMECLRNFPDFNVLMIQRDADGKFHATIRYRNLRTIKATFPAKIKDLPRLLGALQTAIIDTERFREDKRHFELSYEGVVVAR